MRGDRPSVRHRTRGTWSRAGLAALIAATAALALADRAVATTRFTDRDAQARAAARRFLDRYVDADGRVVRRDQSSDTVSEGQSYGLVLAQVAGRDEAFERIWDWTAAHLQRPDGLLAYHADTNGAVDDNSSAADADVVVAWALLRATGPSRQRFEADGRALADAILEHDTVTVPDHGLLLAAGDWATGSPATLNPSYWAIPVFDDLARLTGDVRWSRISSASVRVLEELGTGDALPPDWARVDGSEISATPSPGGDVPDVRYSLDAQRAVVWLSAAGNDASALASEWWPTLRVPARGRAIALGPQGKVLEGASHPVPLVAAAAASFAADDDSAGERLLAAAAKLDRQSPTYYGAAWVALGRALLTTSLLEDSDA